MYLRQESINTNNEAIPEVCLKVWILGMAFYGMVSIYTHITLADDTFVVHVLPIGNNYAGDNHGWALFAVYFRVQNLWMF